MPNKILDDLIAAGVPSDTILAVAQMIAEAKVTSERRAANAARQQRHRQRHVMSRDVTDTSRDPPHAYTSPPEREKPKKVSLSAQLPSDWKLGEDGKAYARDRGWAESKIEFEEGRFRDHALANGRKARNWLAAWRNWVTSPYQNQSNDKGKVNGKRTIMEACDDLISRVRAFDEPSPGDLRDGASQVIVGLIPKG